MHVKMTKNTITPSLKKMQKQLEKVPKKTYRYWLKKTPYKSGNAKRKTTLYKETITLSYPYAKRLDEGWSKQARKGMSKPTYRYWQRLIRKIMRK